MARLFDRFIQERKYLKNVSPRLPKSLYRLDEFPVAKLYLDDVREIVNVLTMKDSDSTTRDCSVKYHVKGYEYDSLEELEQAGGSARDFEIIVLNQSRVSSLRLRWVMTTLQLSGIKRVVEFTADPIPAVSGRRFSLDPQEFVDSLFA